MSNLLRFGLASLCVLLMAVTVAVAEDLHDPPWDASLPNQTSQAWELSDMILSADPPLPVGVPLPPGELFPLEPLPGDNNNPYGPPTLEFTGVSSVDWQPGLDGEGEIPTIHVDEPGQLILRIPNDPLAREVKKVFWQITSDKSPSDAARPAHTNPPGQQVPTGIPQIQWPGGTINPDGTSGGPWYTYNGMIEIRPNPDHEELIFDLVESTNIAEIVIDTVCVPEPSTLALLCVGAVGALAFWRRR